MYRGVQWVAEFLSQFSCRAIVRNQVWIIKSMQTVFIEMKIKTKHKCTPIKPLVTNFQPLIRPAIYLAYPDYQINDLNPYQSAYVTAIACNKFTLLNMLWTSTLAISRVGDKCMTTIQARFSNWSFKLDPMDNDLQILQLQRVRSTLLNAFP